MTQDGGQYRKLINWPHTERQQRKMKNKYNWINLKFTFTVLYIFQRPNICGHFDIRKSEATFFINALESSLR